VKLTAAAVTPPAEHAARRPAGAAGGAAADAGVKHKLRMTRLYEYVGPLEIATRFKGRQDGLVIRSPRDARIWLESHGDGRSATVTYVIDASGDLLICDRHCEHVACSGGRPVLGAGEMILAIREDSVVAHDISNQSTGYCPEPDSWQAVLSALKRAGIGAPAHLERAYIFRRCESCGSTNIIKEGVFRCAVCEAQLPHDWNFGRTRR
jgi:hypothetical protein